MTCEVASKLAPRGPTSSFVGIQFSFQGSSAERRDALGAAGSAAVPCSAISRVLPRPASLTDVALEASSPAKGGDSSSLPSPCQRSFCVGFVSVAWPARLASQRGCRGLGSGPSTAPTALDRVFSLRASPCWQEARTGNTRGCRGVQATDGGELASLTTAPRFPRRSRSGGRNIVGAYPMSTHFCGFL